MIVSSNVEQYSDANNALIVQACDLALHFASRLIQHLLLGALKFDYEKIVYYLRKVAECWQNHRNELERMMVMINDFKQLVAKQASAWRIWQLIE